MQGVKTAGKSERSLIEALSQEVGYVKTAEPKLARYDASTGTYFCATLDKVPAELLQEAKEYYETDAVMKRAQAEAARIKSSASLLNKKATYARLAAQSLEKEIASRGSNNE